MKFGTIMDWQHIVEFLGGATVVCAAAAFVAKKAIDAYLSSRLEQHRSDLSRVATEHSVRFQHLHSERADVLKTLYAKLVAVDNSLSSIFKTFQKAGEATTDQKISALFQAHADLSNFYVPKKIFFDTAHAVLIDEILSVVGSIFEDITTLPADPSHAEYSANPSLVRVRKEFWDSAKKLHGTKFKELKSGLEAEFRRILGLAA